MRITNGNNLQQTTPLAKTYAEPGARFFQMTKTDGGAALVSASMLVLLDDILLDAVLGRVPQDQALLDSPF